MKAIISDLSIYGHDGTSIELFLLPPYNDDDNEILLSIQGTSCAMNLCLDSQQAKNLQTVLNYLMTQIKENRKKNQQ